MWVEFESFEYISFVVICPQMSKQFIIENKSYSKFWTWYVNVILQFWRKKNYNVSKIAH